MAYSYKKTTKKGTIHTIAASGASAICLFLLGKGVSPEIAAIAGGLCGGLFISVYDWAKKRIGLKLP